MHLHFTWRIFSNHMTVVRYCKKSSKVIEFQNFDVLLLQYGLSSRIIGKGFVWGERFLWTAGMTEGLI